MHIIVSFICNLTALRSHKYLRSIIIDFFCTVIPTKAGHEVKLSALSRWIQEVGFSGCRIKSGMTENFGLSRYYNNHFKVSRIARRERREVIRR